MKKEVQLTESVIKIDDLKNTNHVGWLHNEDGGKGYISKISHSEYVAICADVVHGGEDTLMVDVYTNSIKKSVVEAAKVPNNLKALYIFDTRKELYQWLGTD